MFSDCRLASLGPQPAFSFWLWPLSQPAFSKLSLWTHRGWGVLFSLLSLGGYSNWSQVLWFLLGKIYCTTSSRLCLPIWLVISRDLISIFQQVPPINTLLQPSYQDLSNLNLSEAVRTCQTWSCQKLSGPVKLDPVRRCEDLSNLTLSEDFRTCQTWPCQKMSGPVKLDPVTKDVRTCQTKGNCC